MDIPKKFADKIILNLDELKRNSKQVRQFGLSLENPVTEGQVESYWKAVKSLQNTFAAIWMLVTVLLYSTPLSGFLYAGSVFVLFYLLIGRWAESKLPVQGYQTKFGFPFSEPDLNSIKAAAKTDETIKAFLTEVVERQKRPIFAGERSLLLARAKTVETEQLRKSQEDQIRQSLSGGDPS